MIRLHSYIFRSGRYMKIKMVQFIPILQNSMILPGEMAAFVI
jgi:hypothetical protein